MGVGRVGVAMLVIMAMIVTVGVIVLAAGVWHLTR